MVVQNEPVRPVKARFEREVGDPSDPLPKSAHFPALIVVGLNFEIAAENLFSQALEQEARNETVEVALVSENDFGWS